MTEQGLRPVLDDGDDVESQNTAIPVDDTTTRIIPAVTTLAPTAPPPPRPRPLNHPLTTDTPALHPSPPPLRLVHPSDTVLRRAYKFNGLGQFSEKKIWDIAEGKGKEFCWYHLQIDPHYVKPDAYAHILIDSFCPPLQLLDIISLVNDGPFCSIMDDGVLNFRINSTGHANGNFPFRIAARVSPNSLITVSLGDVPRLNYNKSGRNHLFRVPQLELYPAPVDKNGKLELQDYYISTKKLVDGRMVDEQHNLAGLFSQARELQPDCTVPTTMASLVVHVIDTHVDLIPERIANIEKELNSVEENWVDGDFDHNKRLMDGIKFSEMQLKLQRILQVIAQTEQVLRQVADECRNIEWLKVLAVSDGSSLHQILVRPKVFRENVKILANRIAATHARLVDTIQSEQINKKVYILSIGSMIFLPLSIITGVFSMDVSGVPWKGQNYPHGFRNVGIASAVAVVGMLLLYFSIAAICKAVAVRLPAIFKRVAVRRKQKRAAEGNKLV